MNGINLSVKIYHPIQSKQPLDTVMPSEYLDLDIPLEIQSGQYVKR